MLPLPYVGLYETATVISNAILQGSTENNRLLLVVEQQHLEGT